MATGASEEELGSTLAPWPPRGWEQVEEDLVGDPGGIKCEEPLRGDPVLSSTHSPAMASLTQARALRRASERKATTASRPIFIQGLARDRVDAASGKRGPSDADPTVHSARARSPAPGAVS